MEKRLQSLYFGRIRSCKIVHSLDALGKNLAKILTKGFKNYQDSWQELQDILHWMCIDIIETILKLIKTSDYKVEPNTGCG